MLMCYSLWWYWCVTFWGTFCRAINYDEKDPFLCNACGFCKYAKFDFTLTAKPCCAVDPIENEEDRKKVYHQHIKIIQITYAYTGYLRLFKFLCPFTVSNVCIYSLFQAIGTINTLLEKADRIYRNLQQHRPQLEKLLIQVKEHGSERVRKRLFSLPSTSTVIYIEPNRILGVPL